MNLNLEWKKELRFGLWIRIYIFCKGDIRDYYSYFSCEIDYRMLGITCQKVFFLLSFYIENLTSGGN